ncbi:ankyrin repeat-containing domain protein, partial [Pavlovales sp. CCMP2436]
MTSDQLQVGDLFQIILACAIGDLACLAEILARGVSPNCHDKFGSSPAHAAAVEDRHHIIDMLAAAGADLSAIDVSGSAPLHSACFSGSQRVVERLLAHKARTDVLNGAGHSPLHSACREGHLSCCAMLLGGGASANFPSADGKTPLHHVCDAAPSSSGQFAAVLLERGAQPDRVDAAGEDCWSLA